jgi:hypothetical protein
LKRSDYGISGPKWASPTGTWHCDPSSINFTEVAASFGRQVAVIDLYFAQAASAATAQTELAFNFTDRSYNSLAKAYMTWSGWNEYTGSDNNFNETENWTPGSGGGYEVDGGTITFKEVELHETCHVIRLGHPTNAPPWRPDCRVKC